MLKAIRQMIGAGRGKAALDHGDVYDGGDHRKFVGGLWKQIGKLQFDFLVAQGLRPEHVLVDVACGSLRAGSRLIPYLDRGNYLGLEAERKLLEEGISAEIPEDVLADKAPEFVITRDFRFAEFSKAPDYGMANSLFTHLNTHDIELCLRNLGAHCDGPVKFFATFFETETPRQNLKRSHAQRAFFFTREEMAEMGERQGFETRCIGDWNHPRDQKMFLFSKS